MFGYWMYRHTFSSICEEKCSEIKNCIRLIYRILYILWKFVYIEYQTQLSILFEGLEAKFMYIKYTDLYTLYKITLYIFAKKEKKKKSKSWHV